jgi:hypothetical protein
MFKDCKKSTHVEHDEFLFLVLDVNQDCWC